METRSSLFEHSPEIKKASRKKAILKNLLDILVIIVVGLTISITVKTFLVRSFYIPSESMETTLNVQDRIMVNQLMPDSFPLEHGDIVVFKDSAHWMETAPKKQTSLLDGITSLIGLTPDTANDYLVKRVIGLSGDRVTYVPSDGKLRLNGKLIDEPYLNGVSPALEAFDSGVIPKGYIWVMGDNRPNSADSRYNQDINHGYISLDSVVGKAFIKTFPLDQISWLDNYTNSFN